MSQPRRTVGIDFGTSTSLVAEGVPLQPARVTPLGRTTSAMPSWVGIQGDSLVVGEQAQDLPLNLVARSVKRAITRHWSTVTLEADESRAIDADEAIIAVLREIGQRARARGVLLTEDSIRLGCPAMWTANQRSRLLRLAQAASIPVADHTLVDEPIAAGVAWVTSRVLDHNDRLKGRLLVFDMGGGTLDVALLEVEASPNRTSEISVLASAGVDKAGDELDSAIMSDLVNHLGEYDVRGVEYDSLLAAVVLHEARRAKEMLSSSLEVVVAPRHPTLRLPQLTYTREQLEVAFATQLNEAEELVWAVIRESQMTHELGDNPIDARKKTPEQLAPEVTYVLLVGGMSRIPAIVSRLGKMFPGADIYDHAGVSPEEAIVAGLSETTTYDRLNLHRPGFDFVLEWSGQPGRRVLYEAYTPLYQPWEAMQRSKLYYEQVVPARELPSSGEGILRIRSAGGANVDLRIDGTIASGLAVAFGRNGVSFRIYPNGHIVVTDGSGRRQQLRVSRWPVLRSTEHAMLIASRIGGDLRPLPELPWWQNYENMRP